MLGLVFLFLASVPFVRFANHRAHMRETRANIESAHRAVQAFRDAEGRCPRSLQELLAPPTPGVRFLRDIPRDGWGHTLRVRCPSSDGVGAADVLSAGPSGSFLVDDNVR
ncbi:MAG: type II secretion system protein GspG [Myxococcales bacterium]|nr:type II secretion system protein GspG [Myxococcales bacterium]